MRGAVGRFQGREFQPGLSRRVAAVRERGAPRISAAAPAAAAPCLSRASTSRESLMDSQAANPAAGWALQRGRSGQSCHVTQNAHFFKCVFCVATFLFSPFSLQV